MRFRSSSDTEVLLKGWKRVGRGAARPAHRHVRVLRSSSTRRGAACWRATGSGSSRCICRTCRTAACAWPPRCPRSWRGAGSTRPSTRSRCTTTSRSTRSCPRRRRSCAACASSRPRRCWSLEPDGRRRERRYWDPPFERDPARADWSAEDWETAVMDALRVAVRRRMVADVPVGILLSGGLDSSLIAALLAEQGQTGLATFSVGFEDVGDREGDEFEFSDLVAAEFGTDHHQIRVGRDRLVPALPRAIAAMSEPMISHDAVGFFLLSRGGLEAAQGGADRARAPTRCSAATTGIRRCSSPRGLGSTPTSDAFFDRDDAGRARRWWRRGGWPRATRRARWRRRGSARRARTARSTAGCGSTPR